MIKSIQIKNFKSVVDLSLDLGSFNVLIGENGCGKSNILEAIAFGSAASADKLDFEFLGSRGVRVTNPEFMYSAFKNITNRKIDLIFKTDDTLFNNINYSLTNQNNNQKKWTNELKEIIDKSTGDKLATILFEKNNVERKRELKKFLGNEKHIEMYESLAEKIKKISKEEGKENESMAIFKFIFNRFLNDRYTNQKISDYIIYSPEQTSLRKFEETTQIYPLGIKGEGLFQFLKELALNKKTQNTLLAIKRNLNLLDWYEDFELPDNLMQNEYALRIKDKYLFEKLQYFDQRSTNEGFLFLLFYSTLFISKTTPTFFAIDNLDSSFNPKLCIQITRNLAALAKKHKKQVIVTTHNPAILDGLNLKDDSQRLFVVRRNDEGHTRAKRIEYKPERKMKLSELWTNGFIGGLPENF
ncbi:MAG: AAA family ATPase [Bacteroidetes bacterium]|nr:AAA family ATPase [Bacteroidota bacterium]